MYSKKTERAYKRVAEKNPDITNKRHLELLTRAYLLRRNNIISGILFFGGTLLAIISSLSALKDINFFLLLKLIGTISIIVGVCKFARGIHNPLTPNEERELAIYDEIEKSGRNVDISEFDNFDYWRYEQEKYEKSNLFKKIFILFSRISILLWCFIIVFIGGGLYNLFCGINNLITIEERNKNAVVVQATIINIKSDDDEESNIYTYEYTYNDKKYTFTDDSYSEKDFKDKVVILIDSKNPETIIENDGKSDIISGSIAFLIGLFILIYSSFKVRNINNNFSFFSLFWLMFAAAAIGFGIWGISLLISGNFAGLIPIFIGVPMCLMGVFLFRGIFNS